MEGAVVGMARSSTMGGFQLQLRDKGIKEFLSHQVADRNVDSFITFLLERKVRGYLCLS